jgi:hypothetical protein
MSERMHSLAHGLLGKKTLEETDLQEIKDLVNRYPYYAPGQFLLLQKLRSVDAEEYTAQLQKAVLYYRDPLAFEYFVNSDRFYTELDLDVKEQPSPVTEEKKDETLVPVQENTEGLEQEEGAQITNTIETVVAEESAADNETEQTVSTGTTEINFGETETQELTRETEKQPNVADLAFEPYHTVDYFASQGIRLSQAEATKDKFGKQLKSFTEWLKSMKKLPANEVKVDVTTQQKVEHMAEDSVHTADIVTEAMAEVWLKQGNKEKAIETYNKLSLLNPSKRAYFAALIENLKHS